MDEREIWPMELYSADTVFVTGSAAGIVAVSEIDGRQLASSGDPTFVALRDAYRDATQDSSYTVPIEELVRAAPPEPS